MANRSVAAIGLFNSTRQILKGLVNREDAGHLTTAKWRVTVTVGIVPEVESFSYDPAQTFTIISLDQTREGGSSNDIDSWSVTTTTERATRRSVLLLAVSAGDLLT
ncbi:hypothetical protein C9J85_18050 [Haloferax sp. wsp5]|nr:hypothetical protein C9J85_18050 [Haloferax sp. wsp5]